MQFTESPQAEASVRSLHSGSGPRSENLLRLMNAIDMHGALARLKNEQASAEGEVLTSMEQIEQAVIDHLPNIADTLVAQVMHMQNHRYLDGRSIHSCIYDRLCGWIT